MINKLHHIVNKYSSGKKLYRSESASLGHLHTKAFGKKIRKDKEIKTVIPDFVYYYDGLYYTNDGRAHRTKYGAEIHAKEIIESNKKYK